MVPAVRVRRFRKKKFFASKRNEAKRDPFRTLTWKKFIFLLLFASNFSLPTKAKLIERIFALFRFQNLFVSLPIFSFLFKVKRNKCFFALFSLNFIFVSLQMRKRTKKHLLRIEAKQFLLRSENDGIFSHLFCFISLRSENDGSFSLPFRFISLRSDNDGSFSLLFRFVFASFHFRFRFLRFASKRKTFRFCFASFRFEAKMTAHNTCSNVGGGVCIVVRNPWSILSENGIYLYQGIHLFTVCI